MNLKKKEATNDGKIRRILRLLILTFGVAGIISVFGAGYCDHQLRLAPRNEDLRGRALTLREYKGEARFITSTDAAICSVSTNMSFLGIGAACLCAFAYFFLAGGRKDL
jgi:hypothetical protein